jgi:hypothetical protein
MGLTSVAQTLVGNVSFNHQPAGNLQGLGTAIDVITKIGFTCFNNN